MGQFLQNARTYTVAEDDDGQRLDRWLKKHLPKTPYALLQKMLRTGQVRVDGKRAKAEQRLAQGQVVRVPPAEDKDNAPTFSVQKGDADLVRNMVLYDDGDLIVLNKPYGLAVQGGPNIRRHIDGLLEHLTDKKGRKPRLAHRLDRDTSGILLCARSLSLTQRLGKMFEGRTLRKYYQALVFPGPSQLKGVINAPLVKGTGSRKEMMIIDEEEGKESITWFHVADSAAGQAASVVFWPRTGRTHQIRVHTSEVLGCPIIGDEKYGGISDALDDFAVSGRLHLHAARLELPHPSGNGQMLVFNAPLPPELLKSWKAFGFSAKLPADVFDDYKSYTTV